jgi:hypothetical protein
VAKKKKESKVDKQEEVVAEPKAKVKPRKQSGKFPKVIAKAPVVELDRYLQRREVPRGHHEAMRRYTNTAKATMTQWDEIFKDY